MQAAVACMAGCCSRGSVAAERKMLWERPYNTPFAGRLTTVYNKTAAVRSSRPRHGRSPVAPSCIRTPEARSCYPDMHLPGGQGGRPPSKRAGRRDGAVGLRAAEPTASRPRCPCRPCPRPPRRCRPLDVSQPLRSVAGETQAGRGIEDSTERVAKSGAGQAGKAREAPGGGGTARRYAYIGM